MNPSMAVRIKKRIQKDENVSVTSDIVNRVGPAANKERVELLQINYNILP